MSDFYLMMEVIILEKIQVTSDYSGENTSDNEPELKKKHVVIRAMRNKINIFMLQLLI